MASRPASPSLVDYELEEYLRCPTKYRFKYEDQHHPGHLNWRQLVQYAVNHAVHDYYTFPAESRRASVIPELVDRHWTNRMQLFESASHYHQVKAAITERMRLSLTDSDTQALPFMLFENVSVWSEALQTHVSMIVQLAQWTETAYVIRKFVVGADREAIRHYFHMASFVANEAFGRLPERVEVYQLSGGLHHVHRPTEEALAASLDHMKLTQRMFAEKTVYNKINPDEECTECPFWHRCRQESFSKKDQGLH